MMASDGTRPEDLPLERDIRDVRKELKQTARTLKKLDGQKSPPKKPPTSK